MTQDDRLARWRIDMLRRGVPPEVIAFLETVLTVVTARRRSPLRSVWRAARRLLVRPLAALRFWWWRRRHGLERRTTVTLRRDINLPPGSRVTLAGLDGTIEERVVAYQHGTTLHLETKVRVIHDPR